MSNKFLFQSASPSVPVATTRNAAGGKAYELSAEEALAQFAVTGCFNGTFYASAASQLDEVVALAARCNPEVVADVAIYSRTRAFMKDMPAALLASLAGRKDPASGAALARAAPLILDNGRMIRNFAQMIRSGKFGRKSFGTAPKRIIRQYLESAPAEKLFRDSIGTSPSLGDVIKMVHPKASTKEKDALFGYLIESKKFDSKKTRFLPLLVKEMERFKAGDGPMPEHAPFMMLTAHVKTEQDWLKLFQRASWTETRINLSAFNKHQVFAGGPDIVRVAANRIRNPELIRKSKVLPFQLLTAYQHTLDVPQELRDALQDALEVATENVPSFGEGVVVAVDVSGSMGSAVTGFRGSATSATRCVDVAALIASCILRTSPRAGVMPFDTQLHRAGLNPRDSVMTNAATLARFGGGGTDCSLPLKHLNAENAHLNTIIYVSDNESWVDLGGGGGGGGTGLMTEWKKFKSRNPKAKLVLIDLVPHGTSQAAADKDILRVGGFSDSVFDVIRGFLSGEGNFLDMIRAPNTNGLDETV
jgi:60 kDa SS-A/Ro ribonucleoprotein